MNRFNKPDLLKRIFNAQVLSVLVFVGIIAIFIIGINSVSNSTLTDDRTLLEKAVTKDIVHCYAVEGVYPPSLSYIEEHYGLTYDHKKYIVSYEPIGSNIMPSVMIIERYQQQ
ncbi:MAG TPA: hypothetical protein DCL38_09860 [Lachnospiraceae bacterium]|nr:hypothetical protein [Lachnospiraceae bacterium]